MTMTEIIYTTNLLAHITPPDLGFMALFLLCAPILSWWMKVGDKIFNKLFKRGACCKDDEHSKGH